ncbi:MAG TPA: flagellar assembly peptidoglycan hydrolase FlgJ [Janthinobacterium sp.]|nr:flagellar assembly peptidoglycan hydrolase FlgJ [Janthinobacterium sp.]
MISQTDLSGNAAYDIKGFDAVRQSAKANDPAALKTAATQFEAMFINMMLKSMRDATPQDGALDSSQSKMYTSMLDQQTSQNLAKRGTGLADMLMRQMTQAVAAPDDAAAAAADTAVSPRASNMAAALEAFRKQGATAGAAVPAVDKAAPASVVRGAQAPHVRAFQDKLGAAAEQVSRATGIPAKFMLGQAALETGWGKREIRTQSGAPSHNLFGIKAGPEWKGKVAMAVTTEYVNGSPHTTMGKFRAYDSYGESFQDYAKLISGNKRYEKVMASAGDASSFAQGLQRAGYATDPNYATKLTRIIKQSLFG